MHWTRALLVALAVALAGCADDADDETDDGMDGMDGGDGAMNNETMETPSVDLTISTTGTYPVNPGYSETTITVAQGTMVNITFSNEDAGFANHDLFFDGVDVGTASIASGETAMVSFLADIEPGEYPFYCTIGDHRSRGMEGTFIVE